jgi:glycerol-3-phosphate dehydrogenase
VESFLSDLNGAFPRLQATRADVRLVHHGLTPALVHRRRADLLPEPQVLRHSMQGRPGVLSLVGVKYTTARRAAQEAIDIVVGELGKAARRPCRTGSVVLPHADIADAEGRLTEVARELGIGLDRNTLDHLAGWYGTEAPLVVRHAAAAAMLDPLGENTRVLAGEIAYAVDAAGAVRLSDAVLRRTSLGSAGHPGAHALHRSADIMGAKLGWSASRRADELAAVEAMYP